MNALDILRGFARNNAFANERLYAACAALPDADYEATRVSFFPSLRATFEHLYLVDIYYFDAMVGAGRGRSVRNDLAGLASLPKLRAAQHAMDLALVRFVDGLTDPDLTREIRIERTQGVDVETIGDTLLHLYEHQLHHRGQIHAMLSGSAVKPPQLDEYFLRVDRPIADRELESAGFPV